MRWIVSTVIFLSAHAVASPRWGLGLGMESRMQREVNPDYANMKNVPQLYVKADFLPWAVLGEFSQEERRSSSGSLEIKSQTRKLGVWGRYEFTGPRWSPFLTTGVGEYFDRVETTFQSSHDSRSGMRGFWGLGAGVGVTYWERILVELEGRVNLIEQTKDPVFSALLRVGVQI